MKTVYKLSLLAIIIVDQRHGSLYTTDEKYNTTALCREHANREVVALEELVEW